MRRLVVLVALSTACMDADGRGLQPWGPARPADDTTGSPDASSTGATTDDAGREDTSPTTTDDGEATTDAGPSPTCGPDVPFPGADWSTDDPAAHGLDPAALDDAAAWAEGEQSRCLLVIKDGVIVYERYFGDTDATTMVQSWSIAKSHTATAVGIALARGELGGIDDSIATVLPELAGTDKAAITLRHLLSMTAGLYGGVIDDMAGMFTATDMTQKALATPLDHAPGTEWHYSNVAVQMLEPILRTATGMAVDEYTRLHVWDRIGMDAEWFHDPAGNPALYMNVLATCRDHARFGYLYLHRGCWAGEQVVPADWVAQSTAASTDLNRGYGWWWWRSGGEPTLDLVDASPLERGSLHPGGPRTPSARSASAGRSSRSCRPTTW